MFYNTKIEIMQVESNPFMIEGKPAFLVEARAFHRVYQSVNIYEMKAYLMRTYPHLVFTSVCEIPNHLREGYSFRVYNLVSK